MHITKSVVLCLLITITTQSETNVIVQAVNATQESVMQIYNDIATSELSIASVHTWERFQEWIAQRPLQAGAAAGVVAFIACYWLSKRSTQHRSMREQSDAYNDGFDDGYAYACRSYRNNIIWV